VAAVHIRFFRQAAPRDSGAFRREVSVVVVRRPHRLCRDRGWRCLHLGAWGSLHVKRTIQSVWASLKGGMRQATCAGADNRLAARVVGLQQYRAAWRGGQVARLAGTTKLRGRVASRRAGGMLLSRRQALAGGDAGRASLLVGLQQPRAVHAGPRPD